MGGRFRCAATVIKRNVRSRVGADAGRSAEFLVQILGVPRAGERRRLSLAHPAGAVFGHRADDLRDRPRDNVLSGDRAQSAGGLARRHLGDVRHSADIARGLGRPSSRSRLRRASRVDRLRHVRSRLRRLLLFRQFAHGAAHPHGAVRRRPFVSDGEPADAVHSQRRSARPRRGLRQLRRRQRHRPRARPLSDRLAGRHRDRPADRPPFRRRAHRRASSPSSPQQPSGRRPGTCSRARAARWCRCVR